MALLEACDVTSNGRHLGSHLEFYKELEVLGGVYMRKLALARVSYWDDVLISNRVYMMSESFDISLFEGTVHVDKYTCDSKSQTLRMRYPFQSTGRPISHRNGCRFAFQDTAARFRTGVKFSPR